MKRVLISAVAFAFFLMTLPKSSSLMTLPKSSASEDFASSIVGTWKMTSFARKELATGKTAPAYGDHPQGYAHYTKGGHFLIFAEKEREHLRHRRGTCRTFQDHVCVGRDLQDRRQQRHLQRRHRLGAVMGWHHPYVSSRDRR